MNIFEQFRTPPREYTLIPFWFLNDDLDDDELRRQIDDFEAHGVYGFVPHARIGLPESIGFMSDAWLHHVKVCVDHAAAKHMVVVLYDEGMYPSGSCAGKVVELNPRHATRCLLERPKGTEPEEDEYVVYEDDRHVYLNCRSLGHIRGVHFGTDDGEPGAPPSADILNPEATASFFHCVLDKFYESLKDHFGTTVIAVFTDEPSTLGRGARPGAMPWTWDFETFLESYLGYDMRPCFPALFDENDPGHDKYTRDWQRAVDGRLQLTYYKPYSQWCIDHGIALAGHPSAPDDIGTEKFFQIPGQDIVWRYIEPFADKSIEGAQSTMAKCSASAQQHYDRSRNANECFGAYGWEFTEEEMWWISNWLFVRGVNLLYPHAFYYSVRDSRRDERPPDVGPNNVWWDRYKEYAGYCQRLSWLLAEGEQVCSIAILGTATQLPWRAARVLFESQRDFNYLDTDTLLERAGITDSSVTVGSMRYDAIVLDGPAYSDAAALGVLAPMIASGRVIAYADAVVGVEHAAADAAALEKALEKLVDRDVALSPAQPMIRYHHVRHGELDFYLFANEGRDMVEADLSVAAQGAWEWWNPHKPERNAAVERRLRIAPYELNVLCCGGGDPA